MGAIWVLQGPQGQASTVRCNLVDSPAGPGMEGLAPEDPAIDDTPPSVVEAPDTPASPSTTPAPAKSVLDFKRDSRVSTEALKCCLAKALVSLPCPFSADPALGCCSPDTSSNVVSLSRMACCTPSSSLSSEEGTGACLWGKAALKQAACP